MIRHSFIKAVPVIISCLIAAVCFIFLNSIFRYATGIFFLLPVIMAGIQYGIPGGLIAGVLSLPLSILLFKTLKNWPFVLIPQSLIPLAAMITIGSTVGYISSLNKKLKSTNDQLRKALLDIKTLSGLIPICSNCNRVRDDEGYWRKVEEYVSTRTDARFSHGLCPECRKKLYPDYH